MARPSAAAHRSKDWESFQYDIQKKTVNLPRGRSDMLPLVSPSRGGRLSPRSCPSSTYVFALSWFLLFAAFHGGPEKALAYLLNLLLAMECSSRFGEKALHSAAYEMSNGSTWRYFFWVKIQAPLGYKHRLSNKAVPQRGQKKASNLDINKCTKSRATFHKPAVFLPKRETFFQRREVFCLLPYLGGYWLSLCSRINYCKGVRKRSGNNICSRNCGIFCSLWLLKTENNAIMHMHNNFLT